jgi:hypothetical protein
MSSAGDSQVADVFAKTKTPKSECLKKIQKDKTKKTETHELVSDFDF